MTLLFVSLSLSLTISCALKEKQTNKTKESKIVLEDLDKYSLEFASYLKGYEQEEGAIPPELVKQYISPLVERKGYSSQLDYTYNSILYQNEHFIAVTFFAEGEDIYAKFLTTIDLKTEALIGVIDLAANVYTEGHARKGFNTTYLKEMKNVNKTTSGIPLVIDCQFHYENDTYNSDLVTPTEKVDYEREAAMIHDIQYMIDEYGTITEEETIHE